MACEVPGSAGDVHPAVRFFETHCHLNSPAFASDLEDVLARARAAGVGELLVIGFDLDSSRRAVELACPEDGRYAAVGIHPHDADGWGAAVEAELRSLLASP